MRQIVYRSTSTAPEGRVIDHVPDILREAVERNGVDGITGLLYAESPFFLQVIEGPPESIADLMARLARDRRHRDMAILVDREIARREFGDWTMIYRERRGEDDDFDARMRVLLAGVSAETVQHFKALHPA